MFDISNPANPVEVGKYETWRDPDGDGTFNKTITGDYNGAWNIHVFLPSGNVLRVRHEVGHVHLPCRPRRGARVRPAGSSATPGNGQVGLTWTAANGATGYTVRRGTTSGGPYTTIKSNVVGTTLHRHRPRPTGRPTSTS